MPGVPQKKRNQSDNMVIKWRIKSDSAKLYWIIAQVCFIAIILILIFNLACLQHFQILILSLAISMLNRMNAGPGIDGGTVADTKIALSRDSLGVAMLLPC